MAPVLNLGRPQEKGASKKDLRMGVVLADSCCCRGGCGRQVEGKQIAAVRGGGAPVNEAGGSL